ncbi:hypothetical protein Tco_1450203 [Tanacetum coccineum]
MQTQKDHSNPIPALNVDSLKVDLVVIQNTCSEKEDSNSETASSKSVKESSLNSETKDVHAIKYKMSKAKERCMAYFRSLHSHLQVLSKEDLKGTRIEHGFKRAFMSLFGQDNETFTSTMLLNVDQLQKQLDKDEFQEDGSMAAFWVINKQFQQFINLKFTLDYDSQMSNKYFFEYTGIEYDRRVNKRQMQTKQWNRSEVQDDNSRGSGNDTYVDDTDIRPIYDEEPMAEDMVAPTILVSAEENLRDPIDIRVDIIHPEPVAAVAFPAAAVVRNTTQQREAIGEVEKDDRFYGLRLGIKSSTFGKRELKYPRYVGPLQVLAKVGVIAYKLELPQELTRVHNTFDVSNLKKCYADEPLAYFIDDSTI